MTVGACGGLLGAGVGWGPGRQRPGACFAPVNMQAQGSPPGPSCTRGERGFTTCGRWYRFPDCGLPPYRLWPQRGTHKGQARARCPTLGGGREPRWPFPSLSPPYSGLSEGRGLPFTSQANPAPGDTGLGHCPHARPLHSTRAKVTGSPPKPT